MEASLALEKEKVFTRLLVDAAAASRVRESCIDMLRSIFQAMMDRDRKDELPKMQVEFIDVVCRPLYTSLSESFPWIKPLLDGCLSNREKWFDMAEKVASIHEEPVFKS